MSDLPAPDPADWGTSPAGPTPPPPPPAPPSEAPLPEEPATGNPVDLLLRSPGAMLARFEGPASDRSAVQLAAIGLGGYLVYAAVIASFAGGMQWWASPLKILVGIAFCAAICFPSLYILTTLAGARARVGQVAGMLLSVLALSGVFLAGFAPIAWVFSQSSTLVTFIGALHVLVWLTAIFASARVVGAGLRRWGAGASEWAGLWIVIFAVTVLQMATVLRPIVGPAKQLFEPERRFFLQNWVKTLADERGEKL